MYVISVTFPTSNKFYDYLIKPSLRNYLNCGDKIQIRNDMGYDYRESVVTIKRIQDEKNYRGGAELREIVDFKIDGSAKWHSDSRSNFEEPCNSYLANYIHTLSEISASSDGKNLKHSFASNNNETYNTIKKENSKMNKMFNFKYGKVDDNRYAMSPYGIAVNGINGWTAYDHKTYDFVNVEGMTFDAKNFLYFMPVATISVKAGDIVINGERPMMVFDNTGESLYVLDLTTNEYRDIKSVKSPFGFDYMTKVVSLFNFSNDASAEMPFGNMLPFMMMSEGKIDTKTMMLMSMMNGGNLDMSNPMMMLMFANDDNSMKDMLPFLMMGGFNQKTVLKE